MKIRDLFKSSERQKLDKVNSLPKNIVVQYDDNISFDTFISNNLVIITAKLNDKKVGDTLFDRLGYRLIPKMLFVSPYARNQGIAKKMYDYIKSLGFTIEKSDEQTTAGKGFWNKHRGPDVNIWENMNEAEWDIKGWGETPYGTDIDYFGLRVQLNPSTFLKLALPLERNAVNPSVEKHMKSGGKIAYPTLDIRIPTEWEDNDFSKPAKVVSHEGRNRVTNWLKMKGNDPIQVNLIPLGGLRRRDFKKEWIDALNKGIISERGTFISGPLFDSETVLENDNDHFKTLAATGKWGTMGAGCLLLSTDSKKIGVAMRGKYVQSPNVLGTIGGAIDEPRNKKLSDMTEAELVDISKKTVIKEVSEEVGYNGSLELIPLLISSTKTRSGSNFIYYNYLAIVPTEFEPILNWENEALVWMTLDELLSIDPKKLHRGVVALLSDTSSMNSIKNAIGSLNESMLNEATDNLYYYRGLFGAYNTLLDNHFTLSSSMGKPGEEKYSEPGKPYFLSTTRSKVGDYHRFVGDVGVIFNLDGRWISQRYTVKPVDYWYSGKGPENLKKGEWKSIERSYKRPMWQYSGSERTSESEDRIVSSRNTIPLDCVMSIHIYFNLSEIHNKMVSDNDGRSKNLLSMLVTMIKRANELNIPLYVYDDKQAWKLQNKSKVIPLSNIMSMVGVSDLSPPNLRKSDYRPLDKWMELIDIDNMDDLSTGADKLRHNLRYYDNFDTLKNDIHNGSKPNSGDYENVVRINDYMRSNKLKTLRDFHNHIATKWKNINK